MSSLAIARIYHHSISNHPNFTLAITGGSLNALGDCVAQLSQNAVRTPRNFPWSIYSKSSKLARKGHEEVKHYDFLRTVRFFCFGCMISG